MSNNLKAWAHWVLAEHPPADPDRKQMARDICALVKRNDHLEAVLAAARAFATERDSPFSEATYAELCKAIRLADAKPGEGS